MRLDGTVLLVEGAGRDPQSGKVQTGEVPTGSAPLRKTMEMTVRRTQ